jgi:hypothetical protein
MREIGDQGSFAVTLHPMNSMRFLLLLSLSFLGCQEAKVQPGELGGECRIGGMACLDDLVCLDGRCQAALIEPETPNLIVEFTPFMTRTLVADGQAELDFSLRVTDADSGDPYVGSLLLYPSPSTAGRVTPGEVRFEDGLQGLGGAQYVACRTDGADECPEFIFIQAALVSDPFKPIATSEAIKLIHDDGGEELTQASCSDPGGLMAFQERQDRNEEATVTLAPEDIRLDAETGILTLNPSGATVTMRLDASNDAAGRRSLSTMDVQLRASDRFALSSPCGISPLALWSGHLDVLWITRDDAGSVSALSLAFEIACLGEDGGVSAVRGCAVIGPQ